MHYGLNISVVNARFIKPLDQELLFEHAKSHNLIITLEDNVIAGGFGSFVLETLNNASLGTNVMRLGWPDKFVSHGSSQGILRKSYKLDFDSILNRILDFLGTDTILTKSNALEVQ